MAEIRYKIDRYEVEIYAHDLKGGRVRWAQRIIRLFSNGREVAQAVFAGKEKDIPEPYLSGEKIYYFADDRQYSDVMDLLRNEKSVYISWRPVADPQEARDGDAYFHTSTE